SRTPTSAKATSTTTPDTARRAWSSGGISRGTTCRCPEAMSGEPEEPLLPGDHGEDRRREQGGEEHPDEPVPDEILPDRRGPRPRRTRRDRPPGGARADPTQEEDRHDGQPAPEPEVTRDPADREVGSTERERVQTEQRSREGIEEVSEQERREHAADRLSPY